jgi:hypothetical protein
MSHDCDDSYLFMLMSSLAIQYGGMVGIPLGQAARRYQILKGSPERCWKCGPASILEALLS